MFQPLLAIFRWNIQLTAAEPKNKKLETKFTYVTLGPLLKFALYSPPNPFKTFTKSMSGLLGTWLEKPKKPSSRYGRSFFEQTLLVPQLHCHMFSSLDSWIDALLWFTPYVTESVTSSLYHCPV
jgi:hypothetical protein